MKTTRTVSHYHDIPRARLKRYVKFQPWGALFIWIEVDQNDRRFDVASGTAEENEVPPDVAVEAKERVGFWPPYVDWPY